MLVRVMTIARCRRRCAICRLPIRLTSWRSWKRTTTHTWPVLLNCASRQKVDRTGAFEGFSRLVEELEAKCTVDELWRQVRFKTQFCDNQLVRMVLPVLEEDRSVRILRAPGCAVFAQHEICSFTPSKRTLNEHYPRCAIFTTSGALVHAVALCAHQRACASGALDEIIEVARHGLRIASDRSAIGYLFYRLAFAYLELAISSDLALACYRLRRAARSRAAALEEMQGLMNEMGVSEPPTFEEAVETIHKAGLELPPVPAVTNQLADAAVQLVDNGSFSWHAVASSKCGAPWATMSSVPQPLAGVGEAFKEERLLGN